MYTRWTQHLSDPKEKEKFALEIISARSVLERLNAIVKEDYSSLDRSEENQNIYTLPNWDYRQAHKNGVRQYMSEVIKYTDLDQQKGSTFNDHIN